METISTNGIDLAYNRTGKGQPLVLVHGYPLDHTIWKDVVPLLDENFDLILPDLRGFGLSDVVEVQYTISDMAADITGLLDHLGLEKAYIAGHSMGGYISLAFARQYPLRVLGLGLISTQALADTAERKQGRYAAAEDVMGNGVRPVAKAMSPKLTPDGRVQAFVRSLIAAQHPLGLAGALKAMAERDDSTPALAGFEFPVAIVHGDADELIPVDRAQEMRQEISRANLAILPGTGHMPMMEQPHSTAEALKKLLDI